MTDKDRLVEVKGKPKGSGFLIADDLILTAWHLLRPPPGVAPASTVQVRIERDIRPGEPLKNAEQPATILWPLPEDPAEDFDFALLSIQRRSAQPIDPVPWASLPKWGKVKVTAAGYPDVAIDRKRRRREPKGISGWIESVDKTRGLKEVCGTLTMKMSDEDAPAVHPAEAWQGMSGAAVFAGQALIGIVRMSGKTDDRHQLHVLPIDRLFTRDDVAQALAKSGHTVPPRVNVGGSMGAHQEPSWNWPRPWDFSGYINEKRQGFTGRDWLFDETRKWYEDNHGAQALLICADFGVGKSAFMARLTSDAHGLPVIAYHFCHHDTIETLNPATFVCSIAAQLADSLPEYRSAVEADPDARHWLDKVQQDPASAFERAIIGPLFAINPPGAHRVLLVDALDEALDFETAAGTGRATTIVRLLAARARRVPWLRILATTRSRQEVLQPMQGAFHCRTLDGEDVRNLVDIRDYVASRCARAPLAHVFKKGNRRVGDIAAFLSDAKQSGGKFLYAVRVLDDLESGSMPLDRLNDLPPGMDGFYFDAFERRFPPRQDYAPVGALLSVLCVQREPLSLADLAAILCTATTRVELVLRQLEDFLRIRGQRFAFDHLSLTQWLSQKDDVTGFGRAGRFSVEPKTAGVLIADWARREIDADRAHESVYLARHLPACLSPKERKVHFARLLFDFRWLDARLRAAGINVLLTDFLDVDETPALMALMRALGQSVHIFGHDDCDWIGVDQLASQLLGRLQPQAEPAVRALRVQVAEYLARNAGWPPLTDSLRSSDALLRRLEGHTAFVTELALLSDGRLASGSSEEDTTIKLWNLVSGVCEATLEGHTSFVNALVVLSDGSLASGSSDNTIRLWNTVSGACGATIDTGDPVTTLVMLGDGRLVSGGSSDNTIRLWNPASGACEETLVGHKHRVVELAVLADGRLASGSLDHTVKVWNPVSGVCEATLEGHTDHVNALAVLSDGRLASGSSDNTIRLWNLARGACERTLMLGGDESPHTLAVLTDGRLASASGENLIRLWNPASGECEVTLEAQPGVITGLAALADGLLASASDDSIYLWNPANGGYGVTREGHLGPVSGLAMLPDGRLASGSEDATIMLWNPTSGVCEETLEDHNGITALGVLADGRLASGSWDHTIRLWRPSDGVCAATLKGHKESVLAFAALADGRLASGSGSQDNTIRVWNPVSGACEVTLEGHTKAVTAFAVLADRRLASGSYDDTIRLWNAASGVCEATLQGHTGTVTALVALADGRLVSGSWDHTIRLWNPESGVHEATLEGHTDWVLALAVLADGRLASASRDRTVRVWQERNGRWTGAVRFVADAEIGALAFATRAGVLVAGDESGRVHFLKVESAAATCPE